MYLAFTEEQAVNIRKTGLSVIEYKLCFKKGINTFSYKLQNACKAATEAFAFLCEKAQELVDNVRFFVENFLDEIGRESSTRYKLVKFYSKCHKIEQYQLWRKTRVVTRFARSNC